MGNDARVKAEIRDAIERLSIRDFPPEEVEKVAVDCVSITIRHLQLQTNVNQQFDQMLRQLGGHLIKKGNADDSVS